SRACLQILRPFGRCIRQPVADVNDQRRPNSGRHAGAGQAPSGPLVTGVEHVIFSPREVEPVAWAVGDLGCQFGRPEAVGLSDAIGITKSVWMSLERMKSRTRSSRGGT